MRCLAIGVLVGLVNEGADLGLIDIYRVLGVLVFAGFGELQPQILLLRIIRPPKRGCIRVPFNSSGVLIAHNDGVGCT